MRERKTDERESRKIDDSEACLKTKIRKACMRMSF